MLGGAVPSMQVTLRSFGHRKEQSFLFKGTFRLWLFGEVRSPAPLRLGLQGSPVGCGGHPAPTSEAHAPVLSSPLPAPAGWPAMPG